jgi:hypothetical protein
MLLHHFSFFRVASNFNYLEALIAASPLPFFPLLLDISFPFGEEILRPRLRVSQFRGGERDFHFQKKKKHYPFFKCLCDLGRESGAEVFAGCRALLQIFGQLTRETDANHQ